MSTKIKLIVDNETIDFDKGIVSSYAFMQWGCGEFAPQKVPVGEKLIIAANNIPPDLWREIDTLISEYCNH